MATTIVGQLNSTLIFAPMIIPPLYLWLVKRKYLRGFRIQFFIFTRSLIGWQNVFSHEVEGLFCSSIAVVSLREDDNHLQLPDD